MAKLVAESLNERVESRGRTDKVLQFIADAGPKGRRYTDIIKFAYEDKYGPGTYTDEHRGHWAGGFKTPSRDDRGWGHLMKYIQKNDDGKWILRDEKMSREEAETGSKFMEWPGKTQYKKDNYPSTRGDYDPETGRYRPRISKRYADFKKEREEWSEDHDNAYQIIDDNE